MSHLKITAEPGQHALTITRSFDASREQIFSILTDPALVSRWWGPARYNTAVDVMEVKPGGRWRYVQSADDGREFGFHGVYHQVTAPERLVYTFEFEGMPGHVLLETVVFEEHGDKTLMHVTSVFQSVADRDGMIQSGMEEGAEESWNRFEALLKVADPR